VFVLVLAKVFAHWLVTGVPLVLLSPLLGLQYDLAAETLGVLMLSLLLGTPALSLIGAIGAALTLGLRGGGVLVSLLVLPLYIPVLIFGAGAVEANVSGLGETGHLLMLGAILLLALVAAPLATSAALRISAE
jgi:heme exporter protein B